MIKTPVKFDSFDGICGIFDRGGNAVVFTDADLTKDDAEEIIKRINMHEKLMQALCDIQQMCIVEMQWIIG